MYKNSLIIIFLIVSTVFSCRKSQHNKLSQFKNEINYNKNEEFIYNFEVKHKINLTDSINKSGGNLYTIDGGHNEIYIQNILFNKEKDSLYVIAINESIFDKNMFTTNESDSGKCYYYSVVGIAIIKNSGIINFKSNNINIFEMFDNCHGRNDEINLIDIKNNYSKIIYKALKKTDKIDFPKGSGVLFLKDLYTKYYKKNEEFL